MNEAILYADDERTFRNLVTLFLEREGFTVHTAENGTKALALLGKHPEIALVILDVMMPEMDGWQTCRAIREFSEVPILMLTALRDEENEVRGLNRGADDYVSKPFSGKLLVTRVKALLRRARGTSRARVSASGLELDEGARTVTVGRRTIALTPKEFELLRYLLLNAGTVLSRAQILERVWGYFYDGDPRTVDTHVKSLRAKLGPVSSAITTVRGSGYAFRRGSG
jgi:two-component system response regulator ResD